MAGAFRLAVSRATVVIRDPAGVEQATHTGVTVTVRDGVARIRSGGAHVAEMPVIDVDRGSRNTYSVLGGDGSVWSVSRPCGCAGGR